MAAITAADIHKLYDSAAVLVEDASGRVAVVSDAIACDYSHHILYTGDDLAEVYPDGPSDVEAAAVAAYLNDKHGL